MRILIASRWPLGYRTYALKLCDYLSRYHSVSWLSFDALFCMEGYRAVFPPPGVRLHTVSAGGTPFVRQLRFLKDCANEAGGEYDVVYIMYFPGCSLMRVLRPTKKFVLDIRSGAVSSGWVKRVVGNALIRLETSCFRWTTVISEGLREKLKLTSSRLQIVPSGAEILQTPAKEFADLNLLYVGTLSGRRIEDTLAGFAQFYEAYHSQLNLRYTLIGDGYAGQRARLADLAANLGLSHVVEMPGYVPHEDVAQYLTLCNVGVSYIPITAYYDEQPPLKTYEYLSAGMPVIATATHQHRRLISEHNGILITDTVQGFYQGLCTFAEKRLCYDSTLIRQSVADCTWENIISRNVMPFLEAIGGGGDKWDSSM